VEIRTEDVGDADAIADVTTRAFRAAAHSSGTEAKIVEALRHAGALTVSLVATESGSIAGHVAVSPVRIDGREERWFGLGPVSVAPEHQSKGIGTALVQAALERLRELKADGCIVLGDPAFYRRFGFSSDPGLGYEDVPPEYLQRLLLAGTPPKGEVSYHPAFDGS